jgi:YjjI family glycine radical enzyme
MRKNPGAMLPFEDFERGLTAECLDDFKEIVASTIRASDLMPDQKREYLASIAAKSQPYPAVSAEALRLLKADILCTLAEGGMPYHFRYLAPDFERLLRQGSDFLELSPAQDLHEAVASLLTAYKYVPDHGLTPVCLGRLDSLLEPYLDGMPESEVRPVLRMFWLLIDRLHPNAFVHASLGPSETRAGQLLLDLDGELRTVTNVALRYDRATTPRAFGLRAVANALQMNKPYFFNHPMLLADWGPDYSIASCYNIMRTGGGIYTMVRLNLKRHTEQFKGTIHEYLEEAIPEVARLQMEIINSRIRYLVEELGFLDSSFLVREGLLHRDRFTAYAAVFGLAEAVNLWMERGGRPEARFGHDPGANELGMWIIERLDLELKSLPAVHCDGAGGRISFHAQVGINPDVDVTPGCRVPPGTEPPLYEHLATEAPHHRWLDGGASTILVFDQTATENLPGILNIIDGAMEIGVRTLSVGCADSEFIRVSGYLVRKCDLEARRAEQAVRHETVDFANVVFQNRPEALRRRTRQV